MSEKNWNRRDWHDTIWTGRQFQGQACDRCQDLEEEYLILANTTLMAASQFEPWESIHPVDIRKLKKRSQVYKKHYGNLPWHMEKNMSRPTITPWELENKFYEHANRILRKTSKSNIPLPDPSGFR